MQDTDDTSPEFNVPRRRATDRCEFCIQVERAFPRNDIGEPDFEGHRKAHIKQIEADKVVTEYKQEATKKIMSIFAAILIAAASSAAALLVQAFFR